MPTETENPTGTPDPTGAPDDARDVTDIESDAAEADASNPAHEDAGDGGDADEDDSLGTMAEITDLGGCKRRMVARVPRDNVERELEESYRELAKSVQIRGFRKGRVPRQLLEARYGEEIEAEVRESILHTSFAEVVEEKELEVFSRPEFDKVTFSSGGDAESDFTYEATFEVRPDFELPSYKGVEVEAVSHAVSDGDVDEALENIRRRSAKGEPIAVDSANADDRHQAAYRLLDGDTEVNSGKDATFRPDSKVFDHFLIEDLADRVAKWKELGGEPEDREPIRVEVTVPAHYPDEVLRGRELALELTLDGEAMRSKLPEVDEIVAAWEKESVEELRTEIRESLETRAKRQAEHAIADGVLTKLAEQTEMDVPEALVREQVRRRSSERERELLAEGVPAEEAKETVAKEAAEDTEGDAEIRLSAKKYFILEAIAEKEKIFATESAVDRELASLAPSYGTTPEFLRDMLERRGQLGEIRQSIRHEKVRDFLRKKADIQGEATAETGDEPASDSEAGAAAGDDSDSQ